MESDLLQGKVPQFKAKDLRELLGKLVLKLMNSSAMITLINDVLKGKHDFCQQNDQSLIELLKSIPLRLSPKDGEDRESEEKFFKYIRKKFRLEETKWMEFI